MLASRVNSREKVFFTGKPIMGIRKQEKSFSRRVIIKLIAGRRTELI